MRRVAASLTLAASLALLQGRGLSAHAGPLLTDPLEGATLGDTPKIVQLTFSERPEASLSMIRVLDTSGRAWQIGQAAANEDPLALAIRVQPLPAGVYIVNWRVVSAVDGHVTSGAYAFGVRTPPGGAFSTTTIYPAASLVELSARWMFVAGSVALLGALAAALMRFGGTTDEALAFTGWLSAMAGALLMFQAQRRNAPAAFAVLMRATIGRMLILRAATVAAAGAALFTAWWGPRNGFPSLRRGALGVSALATFAAIAIHVAAGHAAGATRFTSATIAAQWAHFAASGVWVGGLAALVLSLPAAPTRHTAQSARRFSMVAAAALLIVAATGIARAAGEISSLGQLVSTGYGRAVTIKGVLIAAIAALGAMNRWRSVPVAATNIAPLRRTASAEIVVAAAALTTATVLATLPPPIGAAAGVRGITVSGADFSTSVRAQLTTVSDQPGANRFTLRVTNYDSGTPVRTGRATLRFTPLDDPGIASTSLLLALGPGDSYEGSGANLAFAGRWQVTAFVELGVDAYEVPLQLDVRAISNPYVSIARPRDQPPMYHRGCFGRKHASVA